MTLIPATRLPGKISANPLEVSALISAPLQGVKLAGGYFLGQALSRFPSIGKASTLLRRGTERALKRSQPRWRPATPVCAEDRAAAGAPPVIKKLPSDHML